MEFCTNSETSRGSEIWIWRERSLERGDDEHAREDQRPDVQARPAADSVTDGRSLTCRGLRSMAATSNEYWALTRNAPNALQSSEIAKLLPKLNVSRSLSSQAQTPGHRD